MAGITIDYSRGEIVASRISPSDHALTTKAFANSPPVRSRHDRIGVAQTSIGIPSPDGPFNQLVSYSTGS